jgi:predicted transporter
MSQGAVTPKMVSGGNLSVVTANPGSVWTAFAAQLCSQLIISNNTGTVIEVQQDGAGVGFPILVGTYYPINGLVNANQIAVRRVDQSNTTATVNARWEV